MKSFRRSVLGLSVALGFLAVDAIAVPAAVFVQAGSSKCLAYPVAVPNGEKDAVVTLTSCLGTSSDGGLKLVTKQGAPGAFSIGKFLPPQIKDSATEASLAVALFPSGSVKNAAAPEKAKGLIPVMGSPLISRDGRLLGLTGKCTAKAGECQVASVTSDDAADFLSQVAENFWGEGEGAVQGDGHQTCRLFGGGRVFGRHRGFGGGYGGFVYVPAVRYHSVQIHFVQTVQVVHVQPPPPPVIVHHHHHHHHYHQPAPCHRPNQDQTPSDDSNVSPAPPPAAYVPPPPPPLPAYVGYYVGEAEESRQLLRHAVEREVAANSKTIGAGRAAVEMTVAQALPETSHVEDNSELYASALKSSGRHGNAQWVAKRTPRGNGQAKLIASGETIRALEPSQIEFLSYFR
jgi:hypothetical protein